MIALLASLLLAGAVWLVVPPWRDDRIVAIHAAGSTSSSMLLDTGRRLRDRIRSRVHVGAAGRRAEAARRLHAVHALANLAAELHAGQPPGAALAAADGEGDVWPAAVAAARAGDDVARGLLADARRHPVLAHLAACWRVSQESGTGLAEVVAHLAAGARSAEDVRVQLEAELAGPRATARTLVVLPLAGIGFGMLMGADPLGWLLGSSIGWTCLSGGLVLTAAGFWWTSRIAGRVEAML